MYTHKNFTSVSKIEVMCERPRVKFMCIRTWKLSDSGIQPLQCVHNTSGIIRMTSSYSEIKPTLFRLSTRLNLRTDGRLFQKHPDMCERGHQLNKWILTWWALTEETDSLKPWYCSYFLSPPPSFFSFAAERDKLDSSWRGCFFNLKKITHYKLIGLSHYTGTCIFCKPSW